MTARLLLPLSVLTACALLPAILPAVGAQQSPLPVGAGHAVERPGLHRVTRVSEKLYVGSAPEGEVGFRTLQELGIRAVLSVDGAPPDAATARRFGLRTVHLPFGYDGCPRPRANEIVRAVRDLPGPVYLHCHHGLHRAPTAAAFARVALDGLAPEAAAAEMERLGAGSHYAGLYADVREYRAPTAAELESIPASFPQVTATPPLARVMVEIDRRFGRLAAAQRERRPEGMQPAHEALQLRELYAELGRTADVRRRPAAFRRWMADAERDAADLEAGLRTHDLQKARAAFGRIASGCGSCHAGHRNLPQR